MVPNRNCSMGYASLLFLQGNDVPINCSVYSLTSGSLTVDDWETNQTTLLPASFLPAYYITNCSIPTLLDLVVQQGLPHEHRTNKGPNPYNDRDNGDTFVALLFTISGSCVSCWMLMVFLLLSPGYQRKPFTTHAATVFYAIVTTILFTQLTSDSRNEYFEDTLDIIRLRSCLYMKNAYRVTNVFSQFFTHLAFLQIIWETTKNSLKYIVTGTATLLVLGYTALVIYYEAANNSKVSIFNSEIDSTDEKWRVARIVLKLLIMASLTLSLLLFTTRTKNPRLCYSKKLFPLALFSLLVIALVIVVNILIISLYRKRWLVKTWLELLPSLFEVVLTTCLWEWIFNIRFLEKRQESQGILGRRISLEEFKPKPRFLSALRRKSEVVSDTKETTTTLSSDTYPVARLMGDDNSQIDTTHRSGEEPRETHDLGHADFDDNYEIWNDEDDFDLNQHLQNQAEDGQEYHFENRQDQAQHQNQTEIQDQSEQLQNSANITHDQTNFEDQAGMAQAPPPSFQPLPGFSADDYWPDKGHFNR